MAPRRMQPRKCHPRATLCHARMRSLLLLASLALVGTSFLGVAAALPPCTCDPMPCWLTLSDGSSSGEPCEIVHVPGTPSAPDPNLGSLDPRDWPCTCDPQPQLL